MPPADGNRDMNNKYSAPVQNDGRHNSRNHYEPNQIDSSSYPTAPHSEDVRNSLKKPKYVDEQGQGTVPTSAMKHQSKSPSGGLCCGGASNQSRGREDLNNEYGQNGLQI